MLRKSLREELDQRYLRVYVEEEGIDAGLCYVFDKYGEKQPTNLRGFLTAGEWGETDELVEKAARVRMPTVSSLIELGLSRVPHPYEELPRTSYGFVLSEPLLKSARTGWRDLCYLPEGSAGWVGESVERQLFDALRVAGSSVDVTTPGSATWAPPDTVRSLLAIIERQINDAMFGPWTVYHGKGWDRYLDSDYSNASPWNTLRERLRHMAGVADVVYAQPLEPLDLLVVQMTADVVRVVVGMMPRLYQWGDGGEFRVVAQVVPQASRPEGITRGVVADPIPTSTRAAELTPSESWVTKPTVYEEE